MSKSEIPNPAWPDPAWRVFEVEPALRVALSGGRPPLDASTERAVEQIWRAARAANAALFNGAVFSVDAISRQELLGHWTEYRRIVARLRVPDLVGLPPVRPLAVAGLVECPDGIVFGRRPPGAVYQAGLWQLAPAGNVDPLAEADGHIDIKAALAFELREELGLLSDTVSVTNPLCMIEHPTVGVLDLCIPLRTRLPAPAIRQAHATLGDGEYPELAIVPRAALDRFVAEQGTALAPQSRLFLARYVAAPGPAG